MLTRKESPDRTQDPRPRGAGATPETAPGLQRLRDELQRREARRMRPCWLRRRLALLQRGRARLCEARAQGGGGRFR